MDCLSYCLTRLGKSNGKNVISQYRRKSGNDRLNIETARICEHHFKPDEICGAVCFCVQNRLFPTYSARKPSKKTTDTRIVDKSIPAESVAEERESTLCVHCVESTVNILALQCENEC